MILVAVSPQISMAADCEDTLESIFYASRPEALPVELENPKKQAEEGKLTIVAASGAGDAQKASVVSLDLDPIESSAVLVRNKKTGKSFLLHVVNQLTAAQSQVLTEENFGEGRKEAILISGLMVETEKLKTQLLDLGFQIRSHKIRVGQVRWSILYRPLEDKIYLQQTVSLRLLLYRGFQ